MGTLYVGEDTTPSMLFLGRNFYCVTAIDDFELLIDYFDFLDKI